MMMLLLFLLTRMMMMMMMLLLFLGRNVRITREEQMNHPTRRCAFLPTLQKQNVRLYGSANRQILTVFSVRASMEKSCHVCRLLPIM
jgi:hypothetical protein